MTRPTLRPMRADETETVVQLWRRSRSAAQPWLEERMRDVWTDDLGFFRGTIAAENEIWVAVDGETIVAFPALDGSVLNSLDVDPRGRGLGTLLMSRMQARSPAGFTLFTHQRNANARAFYEHRGLRAVAVGVSAPPENEPDVKYAWEPEPR